MSYLVDSLQLLGRVQFEKEKMLIGLMRWILGGKDQISIVDQDNHKSNRVFSMMIRKYLNQPVSSQKYFE